MPEDQSLFSTPEPAPAPASQTSSKKRWFLLSAGLILLVAIVTGAFYVGKKAGSQKADTHTAQNAGVNTSTSPDQTATLELDTSKKYGEKYADGILPVGDNKYVTDGAKKGYVYACSSYAQNLKTDQGGAGTRGPWFGNSNTTWDMNKKPKVSGSVHWTSVLHSSVNNSTRTISGNGLPNHTTGVYPIASSDPAYAYDRNPNSIKSQTLTYTLTADPQYGSPHCMSGQVGIMLTGAALFNGFDAGGRDAGAWEVQDGCDGHPEKNGLYHYHTLSRCIADVGVSTIIGFALDGFPITGPQLGDKNILTTNDLDECHGITSEVTFGDKKVKTYHYVMTQDFPYSASCFRAKAIQVQSSGGQPNPSGMTPPEGRRP